MNTPYTRDMSMRSLIADNPMLLAALTRFGISLGFGEASVAEVCGAAGVECTTFLAVANFISGFRPDTRLIDVRTLTNYLRNSHSYFLDYIAVNIRGRLLQAISTSEGNSQLALALLKFYDDYIGEVRRHMNFEGEKVFTYVDRLLEGDRSDSDFSIEDFSKSHSPIHSKLSELKDLLVCHFTADEGRVDLMNSLLFDIVTFERDLKSHCELEDSVFVPAVKALEESGVTNTAKSNAVALDDHGDVQLTAREREIVACVAKGMSNKEIAEKLYLSAHTVATHRRNICAKLNLHSSSALTVYGIMHGLA